MFQISSSFMAYYNFFKEISLDVGVRLRIFTCSLFCTIFIQIYVSATILIIFGNNNYKQSVKEVSTKWGIGYFQRHGMEIYMFNSVII